MSAHPEKSHGGQKKSPSGGGGSKSADLMTGVASGVFGIMAFGLTAFLGGFFGGFH